MASKKVLTLFANTRKACEINIPALSLISTRGYTNTADAEEEIHTGQKFESDDYRQIRFVGKEGKEVNKNWAIKLIDEVPPTPSEDRIVACNGGGGPLGHPKVYINLDKPGNHICGYCGLRFYKEDHHH